MSERIRWGRDRRLHAHDIRVGDSLLGSATVVVRPHGPGGDYNTATAFEIRILVGRGARAEHHGTTSHLVFRAGEETFSFENVAWRATCCRLLGHT
jgi:hypothetical protein